MMHKGDRWSILILFLTSLCGVFLVCAASPSVAMRLQLPPSYFVVRHVCYWLLGVLFFLWCAKQSQERIILLCICGLVAALILMVATCLWGQSIKGARRWLYVGGFSFQASELLKPCLLVVTGWLFTRFSVYHRPGALWLNFGIIGTSLLLLVGQPDVGASLLLITSWSIQWFLIGAPLRGLYALIGATGLVFGSCYCLMPHVHGRINRFLGLTKTARFGEGFQPHQALEGFSAGGLLGKGPGEGVIKYTLPDAHADFIFAVAGEEFGLLFCLGIVGLFLAFIARMFRALFCLQELFPVVAGAGLLSMFVLQIAINIGSSLSSIPTKGIPLPLISYGGSALLGTCITLGFLISFIQRPDHTPDAGPSHERHYG